MANARYFDRQRRARTSSGVTMALTTMITAAGTYCSAAENDERRGFPCTAAMEWQKAAELLAPLPSAADQCWREWERLMRLPRHLAGPVHRQAVSVDSPCVKVALRIPAA